MNAEQLLKDIKDGALKLNRVPCSICREKSQLPRTHFHGSDWGRCIRAVFLECQTGRKPVQDGDDALRLNDGHFHEAMLIKSIELSGHKITHRDTKDGEVVIQDNVKVHETKLIKVLTIGHTDGVMDGTVVIECKAVKDWAWKNKFKKSIIPHQYFGQVQFYLHAHGFSLALLIVKNRHSSDVMVFEINKDEEYIAERRQKLAAIREAIEQKRVIKVPKKDADDECRFCDFYNHCWSI